LAFAKDGLNLRVSEHGDLLVGDGALRTVWVVAQTIVLFLVILLGSFRRDTMEKVLGSWRVWEVLCMKCAQIILKS
jgi:hypothetical protein